MFEGNSKYSKMYECSFRNNLKEQICIMQNIKLPLFLYGCYYWKQTFLFVLLYRQHCVISSDCIVSHHVILRYITHHNNVLRLVMSRYITKCHRLLCSQCTGLNFYGALHSIWRQALGSAQSNALKEITFYFVVCR